MNILVINSGSSSIKFSTFLASATAEPLQTHEGELTGVHDLKQATDDILNQIPAPPDAIGYRVVHPGPNLHGHQLITPQVLAELDRAITFAPLHDPAVLAVIRECISRLPHIPHYACFDTVFHQTMPPEATTYAIPEPYRTAGVHRYGFHGLSCESILHQLAPAIPARLVIAHLGSGCSVTAVQDGRSVDTTMGLTPTGGVIMGTRPGDLDPGLLLYLLRQQNGDPSALEKTLNHDSGLIALSGQPNDFKLIRKAAAAGDERAILALKIFTRSITKAIGSYAWLLGGLDLIVFTGGIGEHDPETRTEILVNTPETPVQVLPAQENLIIAKHVARLTTEN